MEYEEFIDEIKLHGGLYKLTIPSKLIKFAGLKKGDKIRVMLKKIELGVNNE